MAEQDRAHLSYLANDIFWKWLQDSRHFQAAKNALSEVLQDMWSAETLAKQSELPTNARNFAMANAQDIVILEAALRLDGEQAPASRLIEAFLRSEAAAVAEPRARRYLEGLSGAPMRVYQVSRANAGKSLTLVDVMNSGVAPITVLESREFPAGSLVGARVVNLSTHHVLSPHYWPLDPGVVSPLLRRLSEHAKSIGDCNDPSTTFAMQIGRFWLHDVLVGTPRKVMDHSTQEPLELITDFFEIIDAADLASRLDRARAMRTGQFAWEYTKIAESTPVMVASIYAHNTTRELCVFYKTSRLAAEGRAWFDATVGDAVRYLRRETEDLENFAAEVRSDPKGVKAKLEADSVAAFGPEPKIDPARMTALIQQNLEHHYAKWGTSPLAVLENRSPLECCKSESGRERVRGLIHMYAQGEKRQAARDGRRPASFAFLWKQVGLKVGD